MNEYMHFYSAGFECVNQKCVANLISPDVRGVRGKSWLGRGYLGDTLWEEVSTLLSTFEHICKIRQNEEQLPISHLHI